MGKRWMHGGAGRGRLSSKAAGEEQIWCCLNRIPFVCVLLFLVSAFIALHRSMGVFISSTVRFFCKGYPQTRIQDRWVIRIGVSEEEKTRIGRKGGQGGGGVSRVRIVLACRL